MATTTASQQAAPTAKSGSIKRIILIVLVALLAAGAAGAAMWYFMQGRVASAHSEAVAPPPAPPVYFALEPMTVNLQSDDGDSSDAHYLRVGITLKVENQATADQLKDHTPEIRSRVLLALSAKKPSDLASIDGKRALATELAALIAEPTDPHGPSAHVTEVLFTEFVVQ
jgi:flagellar protein FliL